MTSIVWFPSENFNSNYKYYSWNSKVGSIGSFQYYNDDDTNITNIDLNLSNIGEITPCNSEDIYSNKDEVSGYSLTTINLPPYITKNTPYGFCNKSHSWLYFNDKGVATHFAKYQK